MNTRSSWWGVAVGLGLIFFGAGLHPARAATASRYADLYPFYAEYCGLSQIIKNPGYGLPIHGGTPGHGVLFLHGACRELSSPYPKIKLCDASDDQRWENPEDAGVGISVESDFRNVNWTAVEDKRFFFYGDLKPGDRLDRESYLRAERKAEEFRILNGIHFHPALFKRALPGMSRTQFKYEESIGTDFAINFGRKMYCARIPLSQAQVGEAVNFLNRLNRYYQSGVEYHWAVFADNCTHTTHNALASAGVWEPLHVDRPFPSVLSNLAIPINDFANLMDRGNNLPLEDPVALYRDDLARKDLLNLDWLPTQPGSLAEYIPVHQNNAVYRTDLEGMILDWPIFHPVNHDIRDYFTQSRYYDLRANLVYFLKRYRKIKRDERPLDQELRDLWSEPGAVGINAAKFTAFYLKYQKYIDEQIKSTRFKLSLLQ